MSTIAQNANWFQQGFDAADHDDSIPFGQPQGLARGLNDVDTEPQDQGSDEPQQDDDGEYHESGAEVEALKTAFAETSRRLLARFPLCVRATPEVRYRLGDDGKVFATFFIFLWFPGDVCYCGESGTLTGAVAAAVNKVTAAAASDSLVPLLTAKRGKGVARG